MAHVIGQYVVTDRKICHGKPTFRETRIMVYQVLDMVAEEMAWEEIIRQCHGSITKEAIAEAVTSASSALKGQADEHSVEMKSA